MSRSLGRFYSPLVVLARGLFGLRAAPAARGGSWRTALAACLALSLGTSFARAGEAPPGFGASESVVVPSGSLRLAGLVWRPAGPGPFPGVLFTHGSGRSDPALAGIVGPIFARHGYVLLYLFRRGQGLSADQGEFMGELLDREGAARGEEARRRLQLRLLTSDHLDDVRAGVSFLKKLPGVDPARVAVAGHSFGGQLAILAAEGDPSVRAAVGFAPAAASWNQSPALQELLLSAVRLCRAPLFLVYAANDFSTAPGMAVAAEQKRFRKPGGVKIYPAVGKTASEGHAAVYGAPSLWEADVFAFLDRYVRR